MSEGQSTKNPGERFIEILRHAGIEMDYRRIEEMLWLSRLLPEKEQPTPDPDSPSAETIALESDQRGATSSPTTSKTAPVSLRPPRRQRRTTGTEEAYLNRAATDQEGLPASKVRVPMPSALPGSLEIMRALRPFRRRIPSRQLKELDEEETVARTAERGILTPAYLPVKERWFDVAVVVEEKASMAIWRQPLLEFGRVLERLSAFREVRTLKLSLSEPEPRLITPAGQAQSLSTIADPYGRRLVFLVSDGVSAGWQNGRMAQALSVWSRTMPVVIVQMLSERMWHLTPLGKPSAHVSAHLPGAAKFKQSDLPVESVSWEDAQEFCKKLSEKTGRSYRLPSEAEWEYACRAGTTTSFAFGETITPEIVNYNGDYPYGDASKGEYRQKTTPPGSLGFANAFGLFDMHGNVWEWCEDLWHENYDKAPKNGSAWLSGGDSSYRVLRGGSWGYYASNCRSAYRGNDLPGNRLNAFGFRVVVGARTSDA